MRSRLSRNEMVLVAFVAVGYFVGLNYWGHGRITNRLGALEGAAIGLGAYAFIVGVIELFRKL